MAMNMDAVLRIAAKVTGTESLRALKSGISEVETVAKAAAKSFENVASSRVWQVSAVGAGAFALAIGASAKAAIDFESSMADVRKVVSGLETPEALAEIKKEIIDLSTTMPITAQGFAEIYAAAGQSGIARNELQEFATMVGKVSTAFDMTAGEAGQSLAQMKVALGLTNEEVGALADSMNYLSDNTGSTAAKLVDFLSRAGAAGKIAGLSGQETAAFGAAMIQAGIATEVAGTSFNIMLKSLSAGTNMTERQTKALQRLGYSYEPAVAATRDYTREAEAQSRARLATARDESDERLRLLRSESDKISRELDQRYQRIRQQLQDQWEDERDAREAVMARAARLESRALQRQQQRESEALAERYDALLRQELSYLDGAEGAAAEAQREAIRRRNRDAVRLEQEALSDRYELQIEAQREQQQQQEKLMRRADRDREQAALDALGGQQEVQRQAIQQQQEVAERAARRDIEAVEEAERLKLEVAKASADAAKEQQAAAAAAAADAWKLSFAERIQSGGSQFLMEILGRIASLPRAEQLSVLSGLFGDEARGLAPLLGNLAELERALQLSTDKAAAAGSVTREFGARAQTTANQLQLLGNRQQALAIQTGEQTLPAISALAGRLDDLLGSVATVTGRFPGATTALLVFGGAVSALVLAAPGIAATMTLLKGAKTIIAGLKIGAIVAGWGGAIVAAVGTAAKAVSAVALTAVAAWQIAAPTIAALFSGPGGWTVLAVAAVVAMAVAFREPIMGFLGWLGGVFTNGLSRLGEVAYAVLVEPWIQLWGNVLREPVRGMFEWYVELVRTYFTASYAVAWQIFVQPWINLWENVLREPVTAAWEWINAEVSTFLDIINKVLADTFVKPWIQLWEEVLREPVTAAWEMVKNVFIAIGNGFNAYVVTPVQDAWTRVVTAIPEALKAAADKVKTIWTTAINSIRAVFNGFLQGIANKINTVAARINGLIAQFNKLPGPDIPPIPMLNIPQFGAGAFVTRPTIAEIAERGEPEFVVPQSKVRMFANNIVRGRTGNDALRPSLASTASQMATGGISTPARPIMLSNAEAGGGSTPVGGQTTLVISPQLTGPQMIMDGRRFVTYDDLEKAMRVAADGALRLGRTPAARLAQGR